MAIGSCEIRRCHEGESHLHREEYANIHEISVKISLVFPPILPSGFDSQRQGAKQEEEIPYRPHYSLLEMNMKPAALGM